MNVTEINLYPIKSLRGSSVSKALVGEYGLANDRCWMLVDDQGRKITQRECPRFALLRPQVEDGKLRVSVPGLSDIVVPLDEAVWTDERLNVDLWGHAHVGLMARAAINQAFTDATGMSCRLLWLPQGDSDTDNVPFHDDAPLLVISQSSLDDLNGRLPSPVPMNRFRPSVVVAGSSGFEEDEWQRIAIGETEFEAVKLCVRCSITTVDQAEGEFRGPEPLKTLASFRRIEQNVAFGAYFRPHSAGGMLRVGDELKVLETKPAAQTMNSHA